MNKNKYFNKYARITTNDNKIFNIRKIRMYVGGNIHYYGKQYVITPENSTDEDTRIIDEIYSLDGKRFRFLSDTIKKPVILDTIEHSPDNTEDRPIRVITEYEDAKTEIISIPDINKFESDLCIYENDKFYDKSNSDEKDKKSKSNGFTKLLSMRKDKNYKDAA